MTRPYNPQAERNQNPICGSAECLKIIKPHENRVARVEREKVLRELSILIHEWEVVAEGTAHWSSLNRVYRKIESMRQEGKDGEP